MEYKHPHEKIAEFVNRYNEYLEPVLNGEGQRGLKPKLKIMKTCGEFILQENNLREDSEANKRALTRYTFANYILVNLIDQKLEKENFKWTGFAVELYISEIEEILSEDSHYKNARKKLK